MRQHRLHRETVDNIEKGSTVYTDDLHSYKNMPLEYEHQIINRAHEYARDNVHTNGLEPDWSLLKRRFTAPTSAWSRFLSSGTLMSRGFGSTIAD